VSDLTDDEKHFLAIAIQGLCMRQGPGIFPFAERIAEKLGLAEQLRASLRDWIAYAQARAATQHRTEEQDEDRRGWLKMTDGEEHP